MAKKRTKEVKRRLDDNHRHRSLEGAELLKKEKKDERR